jgi:hypothetical protein
MLAAHLGPAPLPTEPRELVRRALAALDGVMRHPEGRRELAKDLLAADALVTYAFELQAEQDVEGLQGLAEYVCRETERHGKRETGDVETERHGKRETGNGEGKDRVAGA